MITNRVRMIFTSLERGRSAGFWEKSKKTQMIATAEKPYEQSAPTSAMPPNPSNKSR